MNARTAEHVLVLRLSFEWIFMLCFFCVLQSCEALSLMQLDT